MRVDARDFSQQFSVGVGVRETHPFFCPPFTVFPVATGLSGANKGKMIGALI